MGLYSEIRECMKITAISAGIGLVSLVGLSPGCIAPKGSFLYENARFNREYDTAKRKIQNARTPEEKYTAEKEFDRFIQKEMKRWRGLEDIIPSIRILR